MPLFSNDEYNLNPQAPKVTIGPEQPLVPTHSPPGEAPTLLQAGMRQENAISAAVEKTKFLKKLTAAQAAMDLATPYDPADHIPERHRGRSNVYAEYAFDEHTAQLVTERLDAQIEEDEVLANGGVMGVLARVFGAVSNPTTLLPGTVIWKAGRMGAIGIKARSALTSAGLIGGSIALEEAVLQESQSERTIEETNIAIATGFIFGGAFGWLAGKAPKELLAQSEFEMRQAIRGAKPAFKIDNKVQEEIQKSVDEAGAFVEKAKTDKRLTRTPVKPSQDGLTFNNATGKIEDAPVMRVDKKGYRADFISKDCP